jgi:hypothetical protein
MGDFFSYTTGSFIGIGGPLAWPLGFYHGARWVGGPDGTSGVGCLAPLAAHVPLVVIAHRRSVNSKHPFFELTFDFSQTYTKMDLFLGLEVRPFI